MHSAASNITKAFHEVKGKESLNHLVSNVKS